MIYKIDAVIGVQAEDGADPEEIASDMNRGLGRALEGFPGGLVIGANVVQIATATKEEVDERGWGE